MMLKVRAVFPDGGFGFDGQGRRRDGDEFLLEESKFDPSWMEVVDVVMPEDEEQPDPPPAPQKRTRKSDSK